MHFYVFLPNSLSDQWRHVQVICQSQSLSNYINYIMHSDSPSHPLWHIYILPAIIGELSSNVCSCHTLRHALWITLSSLLQQQRRGCSLGFRLCCNVLLQPVGSSLTLSKSCLVQWRSAYQCNKWERGNLNYVVPVCMWDLFEGVFRLSAKKGHIKIKFQLWKTIMNKAPLHMTSSLCPWVHEANFILIMWTPCSFSLWEVSPNCS